jgi:hypothetical protein
LKWRRFGTYLRSTLRCASTARLRAENLVHLLKASVQFAGAAADIQEVDPLCEEPAVTLPKPLLPMTFALALAIGCAHTAEVPAAKIDSGLGALPPYSEWQKHPELARFTSERSTYSVGGEKLDNGLGELPPYSKWKNHPALARLVVRPQGLIERAPLALHLPE